MKMLILRVVTVSQTVLSTEYVLTHLTLTITPWRGTIIFSILERQKYQTASY